MFASSFFTFTNGEGSYLAIVVSLAIISLLAIDFVWLRVFWVVLNTLCNRGDMKRVYRERIIFSSQLGVYVTSLFVSNLLGAIASVMNIAWIRENGITIGSFCSFQGGLSQIADVATAYFTATIAVHTFNTLVLHNRLPSWFCAAATVVGWIAAGLMGIVPANVKANSGSFYATDGASCGISPYYPVAQTVLHLVPVLAAALVSALFYSLVFLIIRGTLVIRGGLKLNLDIEARRSMMQENLEYPQLIAAIAQSMLWYPIAYVTLMFPHIIICLLEASGMDVDFVWKAVASAGAAAIGVANVGIFYNMLRIMKPAFRPPADTQSNKTESFVSPQKAESPVDVAPPVADFIPPKAFPPPRSIPNTPRASTERPRASMGHSREKSSGSESTRHLLKHIRSESELSSESVPSETSHQGAALARVITPPGELSRIISAPRPDLSLPAPRRNDRSKVMRRPTLASVPSPLDNAMLSAVPLKTGAPSGSQNASQRNSFINMYGSRSPASSASTPDSSELGRPMMMLNDGAMPSFASPLSGSSLGYTTDSDSDVPRSAFGDRPVRPQHSRSRSLRNEVQERLSVAESTDSGLSSLAWATLVADAATSNGGVAAAARLKTARRRSRSVEGLRIPSALQPRTPVSATMQRERAEMPPMPQTASVTRLDSRANMRNGPSRMAAYRTNEGVNRARSYR